MVGMRAPIASGEPFAIAFEISAQLQPPKRRYWLADACIPAAATPRCPNGHGGVGARENGLRRITNGIMQSSALANLQLNMRRMLDAQEAMSTGKIIRAVSDDPIGASQVMQASGSLRALDQYRRNISSATARVNAEEGALDGLTGI